MKAPGSALAKKGFALYNEGRFQDALACFQKAVKDGDASPETRCFLAHSLHSTGRSEEAIKAFRRLVKDFPDCLSGYLGLANMLRWRLKYDEASSVLGQARSARDRTIRGRPRRSLMRRVLCEVVEDQAMQSSRAGNTEELERLWLKLLKLDPKRGEVRQGLVELGFLRARDSFKRDRPKEALGHVVKAMVLDPSRKEAWLYVKDILRGLTEGSGPGRRLRAVAALRKTMSRRSPRLARQAGRELSDILCAWAREYLTTGKPEEAERLIRGALGSARGGPWPYGKGARDRATAFSSSRGPWAMRLALAEALLQRGRHEELGKILAGPLPEGLNGLRALVCLKRYREAFRRAEKVLDAGVGAAALEVLSWPWGSVFPDQGEARRSFDADLEALARMAAAGPASPWPHFYRGVLLRRCGEPGYRKALEPVARFPRRRYGWMLFELGRSRMHERDLKGALLAFSACLKRPGPADWKIHASMGEACVLMGRPRRAFAAFDKAEAAAGEAERGDALAWRGQMHLWLGEPGRALKPLEEAAALGARYAFCWRGMARLFLGRAKESLPDFDRAIALKPWDLEAWLWRGEAKRRLGDIRGAAKDLDQAVKVSPNFWAFCHRGLARAALRDFKGMAEDLDRIAASAPELVGSARSQLGLAREGELSAKEGEKVLSTLVRRKHWNCRDHD